jgi:hypothetical protein
MSPQKSQLLLLASFCLISFLLISVTTFSQDIETPLVDNCGQICESGVSEEGEIIYRSAIDIDLALAYTMILCGLGILMINVRMSIIAEK